MFSVIRYIKIEEIFTEMIFFFSSTFRSLHWFHPQFKRKRVSSTNMKLQIKVKKNITIGKRVIK